MATTLKRLDDLERATGNTEPEFIPIDQAPGGGWLLDGQPITEDEITRLAARPGVVVIRVMDDDKIGLEVLGDEESNQAD